MRRCASSQREAEGEAEKGRKHEQPEMAVADGELALP
jgi:hypothetical protein